MIELRDWLMIAGSFLSSFTAIFVLYVSTKQTRKIQEENRKNVLRPMIDINSTPSLKIVYDKNRLDVNGKFMWIFMKNDDSIKPIFSITNLSENVAKDIKVSCSIDTNHLAETLQSLFQGFKYNISKLNESTNAFNYTIDNSEFSFICSPKTTYLCRYIEGKQFVPYNLLSDITQLASTPIYHIINAYIDYITSHPTGFWDSIEYKGGNITTAWPKDLLAININMNILILN